MVAHDLPRSSAKKCHMKGVVPIRGLSKGDSQGQRVLPNLQSQTTRQQLSCQHLLRPRITICNVPLFTRSTRMSHAQGEVLGSTDSPHAGQSCTRSTGYQRLGKTGDRNQSYRSAPPPHQDGRQARGDKTTKPDYGTMRTENYKYHRGLC